MSYRVNLMGEGEVIVDDDTGRKIQDFISTGKRVGYFKAGDAMYQVRDVKNVIPVRDTKTEQKTWTSNQVSIDEDYNTKLLRLSKQNPKEKAEREIKVRIKPLLKKISLVVSIQDLFKHIYTWFKNNPKYPWCPVDVWYEYGFGKAQVPYYSKIVINHDRRVYRWLEEQNPTQNKKPVKDDDLYQVLFEPLADRIGGDLDEN